MLKKLIIFLICLLQTLMPVLALEFDVSVDEEIRKKYNSTKLQYDVLPTLPKVENKTTQTPPKANLEYSYTQPVITAVDKTEGTKIPAWTKFKVKSNGQISDWQSAGAVVSFTSTASVNKNFTTIPAGTVFRGTVVNSHQPQLSGNGGLVVLKLDSMTYNGKTYPIDGKIIKANSKKIFFNNIKGERKYWKGVAKRIDAGETFYKKARQKANKFADNPILIIISPVPTVVGMAGYAICTVLSPITALTTKGSHISIPSGSNFEIKLLEPTYVK